MKPPYRTELQGLDQIYGSAVSQDVSMAREVLDALGQGAAIFVGSGGSMVLAELAARLHERTYRRPARACTTLELLDTPQQTSLGALLFTSSAKHPDAIKALSDFSRGRFRPAAVFTHREPKDVLDLAGPDTLVQQLPRLPQSDGFLATGSILQNCTILLRAHLGDEAMPKALVREPEGLVTDSPIREEVLVLTTPSLAPVAADLEVRLVESGLAAVQVADYRNFAHGRHTGFARRMSRVTVIALSDRDARPLAEATTNALPAEADVRCWFVDEDLPSVLLQLLVRSMRLAGLVGEGRGLDVARPVVPAFGRTLYRLPLARKIPALKAAGIERKMISEGLGFSPARRSTVSAAASAWSSALSDQRFRGVVLDYDGTVCWTRKRFDLPDPEIQSAVLQLLGRGLHFGFASGRGRSLYHDLRKWVPDEFHPQVVVGLYNGALTLRLDDEESDWRGTTEWSQGVAGALASMSTFKATQVEERGVQVSVELARLVMNRNEIAGVVRDALEREGFDAKVLVSGHSLDVIQPSTSKIAVVRELERASGGSVLAIGDQGQVGGNDHELLSCSPWSLTVDRSSSDLTRCWFGGGGDRVGPDLTLEYLRRLKASQAGWAVRGLLVQ